MERMTAAEAIVEIMVQEGVEKVFCVPGESYLDVMNALYDHDHIQLISGRHEGGISFMAEGYAKASGKVGVCLATRGPGAANLSIGLHTAMQDSTPVVALIGQVEQAFRDREGFQEIDLAAYFRHLVKWTAELREASRAPELLYRAFHIARTGRPGPVLISLPEDVLNGTADMRFQPARVYSLPRPERESVARVASLLQTAHRPVVIAGGGISARKSTDLLVTLAEWFRLPVATAFRRMDAFPNHHACYIGHLGLNAPSYLVDAVQQADVVLALGTRLSQVTSQDYTLIRPGTQLIHVDISPDEINKVYRPAIGIVADVGYFLEDLLEVSAGGMTADLMAERESYTSGLREAYSAYSKPRSNHGDRTVDLEGLMHDLQEALPEGTIITSDAGNFFGWLSRYYRFREAGTYIGPTSGAMGYGLPAAIGAKLARPERTVIAFAGDGGFMMTMAELETAIRYQIPVVAVVVVNNMYGTIRMHQEKRYPERVIGTDLSNPSYAEYVRLLGGHGETVRSNRDFLPALERALESNRPTVIEVMADPEQISAALTIEQLRRGWQHNGAAV
ncbi:Acetolactate synthase [Kyrpidia spormannii]|uniref:Acetolactate synthase n=1 Tax=Kyrpidia spormannii TaxID=2055160 RepID=A0ACA8Z585_9BACL|nr:thiamine pyrophosphate-dependent enzyme [Kyrpidia spormannii]CAB3389537.1 Acetolactate synthase [Kyrpidia spormannii]